MKYFLYTVFLFLLISLFHQCANPSNPSGGPKDTIPPEFISSTPEFAKTNFNSNEITMIFNEKVSAEKLKQNLLITPTYEGNYTSIIRKNLFTIKFEEPFKDSTTYTLNFFEGITDITEKNPAQNLVYVFSTGNYLDSLSISGHVRDLLTKEPIQNITVALFQYSDTLDVSKHKPLYFTKTDEEGNFLISYIKTDTYKLFAYQDDNRNLLVNTESEKYGFLPDSLLIDQDIDSLIIDLVEIDASDLELISARTFSNYFDIRYNKEITRYRINPLFAKDSIKVDSLGHQLANENKNIRLYHNIYLQPEDSLSVIIEASDSLTQLLIDTISVNFNESTPGKEEFKITNNSLKPYAFRKSIELDYSFNKPVYPTLSMDSIFFRFDTLYFEHPDTIIYNWNYSGNQLNLTIPIDWNLIEEQIKASVDTSAVDSTQIANFELKEIQLLIGKSTFVSVEKDSIGTSLNIEKYNAENFGVLRVDLKTEKESYTFELIDKKGNVIRSVRNIKNYVFDKLPLGSYTFRILYDQNGDGIWSAGNVLKDEYPEPVFLYGKYTELRPNFEILIEDFSF